MQLGDNLGRNFTFLWTGQSVSQLGSQITILALPLVALTHLDASSLEVSVMTACAFAPFLVIGLPAGAWVDRMAKRSVMIAADLVRFAVITSVPVAALLGILTIFQLYMVALIQGVCVLFFDIAYRSILPSLVGTDKLVIANGRLEASVSASQTGGPALGGILVAVLTAPVVVLVDAVSFLISVLCSVKIRVNEAPADPSGNTPLWCRVREGLRFVFTDATMRAIAGATAINNLAMGAFHAVALVFLIRELHVGPIVAGAMLAITGLGGVLGAAFASRVGRSLGMRRSLTFSIALASVFQVLIPLAAPGVLLVLLPLGRFGFAAAMSVFQVAQLSYRQAVCPPELIGRMTASLRFVVLGVVPVGSLLGGVIAMAYSARIALAVAAVCSVAGALWIARAPIPRCTALDSAPAEQR